MLSDVEKRMTEYNATKLSNIEANMKQSLANMVELDRDYRIDNLVDQVKDRCEQAFQEQKQTLTSTMTSTMKK